jgi:hypothetical protein
MVQYQQIDEMVAVAVIDREISDEHDDDDDEGHDEWLYYYTELQLYEQ